MVSLELIDYVPHQYSLSDDGNVAWERDIACRRIKNLPQLFWTDGTPWVEANLWAHERATSGKTDLETILSNMRHLCRYAQWLEAEGLDWRHFPVLERDRALIRWRKKLMETRDKYGLLPNRTGSAWWKRPRQQGRAGSSLRLRLNPVGAQSTTAAGLGQPVEARTVQLARGKAA